MGEWYWLKGDYSNGKVKLYVNSFISSTVASGEIIPGVNPVIVGESFKGNIDSFVIYKPQEFNNQLVELTGVDANGQIQLDDAGHAQITLNALGHITPDSFGEELTLHIIASPEEQVDVKVVSKRWYAYLYNIGKGFVWGDAEGIEGAAGDFAAGMVFSIGDVRDIAKNLAYTWPGGEEPDWTNFGFAAAGLATEFAPFVGEVFDAVISAVKTIISRIPGGPFKDSLIRITKRMWEVLVEDGPKAAVSYAEEYVGILKALISNGDDALSSFNTFIKSSKAIKQVAKLQKVFGDEIVNILTNISKEIGPEAAEKVIRTLSKNVDDTVLQSIKDSGKANEALEGLAKALNKNVSSGEIQSALKNELLYSSGYKHADLLVDIGDVAHVPGLNDLVKMFKMGGKQVKGFRFELESAVHLVREGEVEVVQFTKKVSDQMVDGVMLTKTDIDIVVKDNGVVKYLQAKNGKPAVGYGAAGLKRNQVWVTKARADLKASGYMIGDGYSQIKYVMPDGVLPPPQVAKWFEKEGIEVIPMPYKY